MDQQIAAWSRYKKVKVLGAGATGQVYLVETSQSLSPSIPAGQYVIKRICIASSPEILKSAATEVKILEQLEAHDNLVRYYEHFFDDDGMINIVMEHCQGGDLETYLKDNAASGAFSPSEAVHFAFQLFAAVLHLHKHGVLHRDLKPANVLLSTAPSSADGVRRTMLKVSDFGISRVLERTASIAQTVVGTPFYMGPELCNGEAYTFAADMWSLGCILYELASGGQRCFGGATLLAVVRAVCEGVIPPIADPMRAKLFMPMITPLIQVDPSKRFSAEDCMRAFFLPDPEDSNIEDEFIDPDDADDLEAALG
ncbi:protein kinase, putative [Bodo saltans]|uniref:non-specific serine/threonine protein kinase n=1 Tax=Bodo saltans TaxID=75058 RepID=A0A0S4ISS4_BODSA|nr:protein kinase, putative [Bodo saltans]|eukprot:CUG06164.1 protein kinase, putative [Bodo saltans]